MAPQQSFLNQPAPENYVAGLGRGATGFTTRSDLGPARSGPSEDQIKEALAKRAAQLEGGGAPSDDKKDDKKDDDDRFQDPENEVGLFASGAYDREDDEADQIYQAVDERMEKRRKFQREDRERRDQEEHERRNPKIQQQFSDLKRALGTVSDEDWASIPEVGDMTGKNKRVKRDNQANRRFYAVPDSVIAGADAQGQYDTSIEADGAQPDGQATNGDTADGTKTNFADIGRARDKVLQVRLDQAAKGATVEAKESGNSTNVDPKGYLTSLAKSTDWNGENQIGDIKRVRSLLESVIKTNPKHAPGWIAAARLEEVAGKQVAARNVMARGCENCPKSEIAWRENIRLNEKHNARIIAAAALKHNKESVDIWLDAMNLEDDNRAKKRIVRQAIDHNQTSITLWREAVNLEEDENDARLMLAKATEVIPTAVELWLALARLENADDARKVLNRARKAVPTSADIWLAAARLQEQIGKPVEPIMRGAVSALVKNNSLPTRDYWVAQAERAEEEGAPGTCAAIVKETLGYDLEDDELRKRVLLTEAQSCMNRSKFGTARAIFMHTLQLYPEHVEAWKAFIDLEKNYGKKEDLFRVLDRAVGACPKSEDLWIANMHEKWLSGDLDAARQAVGKAFSENEGSETIWLAAVKLEADSGQFDRVRALLEPARSAAGTDRVWIKSVAFERTQDNPKGALALVADGLAQYPKAAKLHMMKGQIYQFECKPPLIPQAREAYLGGTRVCPKSVGLWILASRLEEQEGALVKARSLLERARVAIPKNARIWVECVRVERRAGNDSMAKNLMSRALQDVPSSKSGILWAERIWHLEPRNQRKPLALEAIKKADNDPVLFVTVARIFWAERRLEKAASWFEKAVVLDADDGDTWGWYLKFLIEHGQPEKRQEVIDKCLHVVPKHGEVWPQVRKDPRNAFKTTEEILKLVVEKLQ